MPPELLLDTGGLVSLLDRSQARHEEFIDYFRSWTGRVLTTEAVITEATHLLQRASGGADRCLLFVLQGGAELIPGDATRLERCSQLMRKYDDLPMDYADATLVALAEEFDCRRVLTTDRRDFGIYRTARSKAFEIVP